MMLRSMAPLAKAVTGFALLTFALRLLPAADLPIVRNVEWQPLAAQIERLVEALDFTGTPLPEGERAALRAALAETDGAKGIEACPKSSGCALSLWREHQSRNAGSR